MAGKGIPGRGYKANQSPEGEWQCVWGQKGWWALLGRTVFWDGWEEQPSASLSCVTLVLLPQKGVFQLSNEDYFIEPLDGVPARTGRPQPHVVYKRQAPEKRAEQDDSRAPGTCGVEGEHLYCQLWARGWAWGHGQSFLEGSINTTMLVSCWTKGLQTDQQTHHHSLCPPNVPRC